MSSYDILNYSSSQHCHSAVFGCAIKGDVIPAERKIRLYRLFDLAKGEYHALGFACFFWRKQKGSMQFMTQKKCVVEFPVAL